MVEAGQQQYDQKSRYMSDSGVPTETTPSLAIAVIEVPTPPRKIKTVSNRLPVEIFKTPAGEWAVKETIGGLVTGVLPVLRRTNGNWYGYAGLDLDREGLRTLEDTSMGTFVPVEISKADYDTYYGEIANRALWGVFHDSKPEYTHIGSDFEDDWLVYQRVNEQFAKTIAADLRPEDALMVHDYHLLSFAAEFKKLRRDGVNRNPLAFFLHIPFPSIESLSRLPNARALLRQMLAFDFIGFHTHDYRHRFIQAVQHFIPEAQMNQESKQTSVLLENQATRIGVHPISIDSSDIQANIEDYRERGRQLRHQLNADGKILFADAGRADHTKGTHQTLKAFDMFLTLHPELKNQVAFALVLQKTRGDLQEYQAYQKETARLIAEINAKHSSEEQPIIHFIPGLPREQLIALMTTTDIQLTAPERDGMNLIDKEYMIAGPEDGILITGKGVGAAQELYESSLLVDPANTVAYAQIIYQAVDMQQNDRELCIARKATGKAIVEEMDAIKWGEELTQAAFGAN